GDAIGEPRLDVGARDEPGLGAGALTACDHGLDAGQRNHEVAETEGNGSHMDATHAGRASEMGGQGWSYSVTSAIPSAENARRRSAHLLQCPQCRPPWGSMQEKVRSSARPRPSSSTSDFVSSANGTTTSSVCPSPRCTSAPNSSKNSRELSGNGFPFSVPSAIRCTPWRAHQTLGCASSSRFRPGRYTASSGDRSSGTSVLPTLQCAPYTDAIGASNTTSGS